MSASSEVEIDELYAAIEHGDMEAVDRSLQSGILPNFAIDVGFGEEKSLLYVAAMVSLSSERKIHSFLLLIRFVEKYGQKDVAALLIDRGAQIDKGNGFGDETPLLIAAEVCWIWKGLNAVCYHLLTEE